MDEEFDDINEKAQRPTIKQASILFTIAVLLFVTIGSRAQRYDLMKGVIFTEFVLIMGSALFFLKAKRYNIKEVLRLNRVDFMPYVLTFFIMLFTIPVISIVNLGNLSLIKYLFGKILINQPPVATNFIELLISVAVIGGSAGICEEILFRGVLQRAYEGFGWKKGIFIAAFLFGMMHMDFQKLIGTFLLGALIGYMVYRTKSLYIGMFAHFCNNSLAVLISYWATKFSKEATSTAAQNGDLDFSFLTKLTDIEIIVTIITWLVILGLCVSIILAMFRAFNRCTNKYTSSEESLNYPKESYRGLLYTIPAILLIVTVYFYQGYKLSSMKVPFLEEVLQFIMGR